VLRITFLSGFTLELAASLSVALVAVSIGLRLVAGDMTLAPGLLVLVLAPEVFLPLRNVGAAFHASAAGVTASSDAFDLLDAAEAGVVARTGDEAVRRAGAGTGVELIDVRVRRGDRIVVDGVRLRASAGQVVAVTGESGSGKSSLFAAILGFAEAEGEVLLDGHRLAPGDRSAIAWAGQTPTLLAGTVADNVRLGDETAPPELLGRALRLAGVDVEPERRLGPGGSGLSGGQAQRVATARAIHRLLARDGRLLLLDEPSSALDPGREAALGLALRELAAEGRTVLVATHRTALVDAADASLDLAVAHA
jgi:ATP-binding cassette subfamily C protein CydD